jgi:pimeloyl-ACP methyl ester carboxylesterase/tetratricopeptide (TPR) repeat protein
MATPSDVPLRQVTLTEWSARDVEEAFRDGPLLLQIRRAPGREDPRQRRIILFVHGLNSSATAWLGFLAEAFPAPELQTFDFALFNYQTSLVSRLNPFQRLPRVEDWARVLANVIQTILLKQERYESFVIVGHSMGGLVSKFAFRYLLESDAAAAMRLHSLFTYGTPNHGSDRAGLFGSLFSPDLAFLRAFSAPVHDLQTFWNSRISAIPETPGKLTVHERAIISVKDYWVAPASGISTLPEKFVQRLASSHGGLIEPSDANDPRLRWFIEQLQAIQKQSECFLIEIRNGPGVDCFVGEDAGLKFAKTLFESLFVLDSGGAEGVEKGDQFGLFYEPSEVRDREGRIVDRIPGSMNLLSAIDVKERVTYCKLLEFAYEPAFRGLDGALEELKSRGADEISEAQGQKLLLALFGRRASRIPRRESGAAKGLKDIYGRVLDEQKEAPAREKALRELLLASREFLSEHPGSVLSPKAAFHEAWSTMELGRYEEAAELFERFCEKYPFSTSVKGARRWIDEIRYRIRLRDSGNAPERQLELAEYFVKEDKSTEEAITLAFEAYSRKPELLGRMSLAVRVVMTTEYVFRRLFGMEIEAPQAIGVLLDQYRGDAGLREQTRVAIGAKAGPDRAKLLLQLLDSTSADWKAEAPVKN